MPDFRLSGYPNRIYLDVTSPDTAEQNGFNDSPTPLLGYHLVAAQKFLIK
tara:strand:- start:1098 stop:1247 length:150 start_codon:yes stop_codon:yes gene_type:complete